MEAVLRMVGWFFPIRKRGSGAVKTIAVEACFIHVYGWESERDQGRNGRPSTYGLRKDSDRHAFRVLANVHTTASREGS